MNHTKVYEIIAIFLMLFNGSVIQKSYDLVESLFGANGERLAIKYKLTDVHIRNHDICIKQTFILVKNLKEKALLGIAFLSYIYPLWVDNQGIRTKLFDKEILFEFANPIGSITPLNQEINLVGLNVPSKIIGNE